LNPLRQNILNKQNGFITADFIFAIILIFGLTAVLFTMTFTMMTASLTQYITFAAARNYTVGHATQQKQTDRATAKYNELVSDNVFAPLYRNGWYVIGKTPDIGDMTQKIPGYEPSGGDPNLMWGVGTDFTAKILDFKIPLFGSSDPDGSGDGSAFKTFIGSYTGREPTTDECVQFVKQRWTAITNLSVSGGAPYSTAQGTYTPFTDDGC
jgi:hypothetical protein